MLPHLIVQIVCLSQAACCGTALWRWTLDFAHLLIISLYCFPCSEGLYLTGLSSKEEKHMTMKIL